MATLRLLLMMVIPLALVGKASGQSQQQQTKITQQYKIKADWLGAFGGYVKWPEDVAPKETFVVGILGGNAFIERDQTGTVHDYLAEIATKKVGGKRIVVYQFNSIDDYKPCHVLFISPIPAAGRQADNVDERLNAAIAKLKELNSQHVLLVSDTKGMVWKGTTIDFFYNPEMDRVNMLINRDAEGRAGLTISAEVLSLRVVKTVTDTDKDKPATDKKKRDAESN